MYEGIDNIKDVSQLTSIARLKLAIVGPPKVGKSTLASTAPKPVLFFDSDDRPESLAGKEGVLVKTYKDIDQTNPKSFSQLETDISMFEYLKSQNKEIPSTFVIDSMSYWSKWADNYYMQVNKEGVTEVKMGSRFVKIIRGFNPFDAEREVLTSVLNRLFALGHTIAIFHEAEEKSPDSTMQNPKFTGKLSVHPPRLRGLLPMFNELWRCTVDGTGFRSVQVKPNYEFVASTCLELDESEEPNIEKMLLKHQQRYEKQQATKPKG